MNLDLSYFVPREMLIEFRGKALPWKLRDWPEDPIKTLKQFGKEPITDVIRGMIFVEMISKGAKLVHCNKELFDALLQLDLRFPMSAIEQPFPVMIFNFGKYQLVTARTRNTYSLLFYDEPDQSTPVMLVTPDGNPVPVKKLVYNEKDERYTTIKREPRPEDEGNTWLGLPKRKQSDYIWATIALNMLLVYSGVINKGAIRPKTGSRRSQAVLEIPVVAMKQEHKILEILFENKRYQHEASEATGRTVRPHWRRAHMRFVRSGVGRVNKALHLIPAVFVNRRLLQGSLSDTEVTFK